MNKHRFPFWARAVPVRCAEFGSAMFGLDEFLRMGIGKKLKL